MNRKIAVWVPVASILVLSGCDVPPQGTGVEDVARYQAAVESIGCEMVSEYDYLPVELQADLTREQSTAITQHMLATGKAVRLSNGGVKLTTGACA
jgi:hypothetical protein